MVALWELWEVRKPSTYQRTYEQENDLCRMTNER